jgi:hypothetical protein
MSRVWGLRLIFIGRRLCCGFRVCGRVVQGGGGGGGRGRLDLVDEREVLLDDFLAVRAVEVGLQGGGGGENMRGCVAKARGGGCDLDEVYDLEHELEHHGGIHVAAGGGNEVADGRVSARGETITASARQEKEI